jgi:hypothetical protein
MFTPMENRPLLTPTLRWQLIPKDRDEMGFLVPSLEAADAQEIQTTERGLAWH